MPEFIHDDFVQNTLEHSRALCFPLRTLTFAPGHIQARKHDSMEWMVFAFLSFINPKLLDPNDLFPMCQPHHLLCNSQLPAF